MDTRAERSAVESRQEFYCFWVLAFFFSFLFLCEKTKKRKKRTLLRLVILGFFICLFENWVFCFCFFPFFFSLSSNEKGEQKREKGRSEDGRTPHFLSKKKKKESNHISRYLSKKVSV